MKTALLIASLWVIGNVSQAANWAENNAAIVDKFAIPAYETLQKNSDNLVKSSDDFCAKADDQSFGNLKANFHSTMDAWQSVQILRSGPAGKKMRSFRLEMWPDRSNAAAKHLRKLQQEANPANLEAEKFAKASTAVQGLSAMERVIYAKEVKVADFQTDGKAKANFKCQLLYAISLNVQTIANNLLKAWQQDYRDVVTKTGKENAFYETDKEVTAQFLNDLNTQLQVIMDQKIHRPIDGDHFRLTRAESWRSQRSLRNIALNLQATKMFYDIGFASHISDKTLRDKQQQLFATAIALGKDLEIPLSVVYNDQAEALNKWISSIKALKTSINTELPKAIDISLGFNSLDGD